MKQPIDNIQLEYLTLGDYEELKEAMIQAYPNMQEDYWEKADIRSLIDKFPEGQVVIKINNSLAGCALSIIVDSSFLDGSHTYEEITGNDTFNTHDPQGDVLYGVDIFIKPEFRGLRLGRRLYDYRKELTEKRNLKGIAFGGRLPNYHLYAGELTPKQYIDKVRRRELDDPVLNFQIANDFHPSKILKGYLKGDSDSKEFAVLMEWDNIYYEKPTREAASRKKVVRLGLVQWQMRFYKDLDGVMQQAEYFIDAVSEYRSDFVLFPEFFNAPLMAAYNHLPESEAIRTLAQHTPEFVSRFSELAIAYNINIITGSMPEVRDGLLYNAGYLCARDGTTGRYEKLHMTPDEERLWGMQGGDTLKTFETDCGRIGVLICYDVEFPELGRLLADEGLDILFVPFLTDTQNGYARVRNCARARAIENECYVAIAGSVGNLPKVHNMDIQYAQSAVLTPCDFAFPSEGIKEEATPNTEMILIADLDMDLLLELNQLGSVRNLKDRRLDLYELKKKRRRGRGVSGK